MNSPVSYGRYYFDKLVEAHTLIHQNKYREAGYILHRILWWLPSGLNEEKGLEDVFLTLHDDLVRDPEKEIPEYYTRVKQVLESEGYLIPSIVELALEQRWI